MAASERDGFRVIGFQIRASNENPAALGGVWEQFLKGGGAAQIGSRLSDDIVAVYCEYEGDHEQPYTFLLGCRVREGSTVPDGMVERYVPGGQYEQFEAVGEQPKALMEAWPKIWTAPIQRAFDADFEVHHAEDRQKVSIFIGVRP